MHRYTTLAAVLLGLSCLPNTAAAQGDRGLKIIPVADLMLRTVPPRSPRLASLTHRRGEYSNESESLLTHRDFRLLEADQVIDLVRIVSGFHDDEVLLGIRDRSLIVTGSQANVSKVATAVQSLREITTRRFGVSAALYRIDHQTEFPARATAEQLAALTKGLERVWSGQTRALTGQPVVLSQESFTRYVADVEIEVSEEISTSAPVTGSMFQGIRLVIENHALAGSADRVFKCQFSLGENETPIALQSTGLEAMPKIGIPNLRAASGSFSGRVQDGGALLVTLQSRSGSGANMLLVVQAAPNAGQTSSRIGSNGVLLPISALTSPSLSRAVPTISSEEIEGDRGRVPSVHFQDEDREDRGEALVDLLRESLGEAMEEEGNQLQIYGNGIGSGFVLIVGKKEVRDAATRILVGIQEQMIQGVEARVRATLHAAPRSAGPFSALGDNEKGEILHTVTYPTLIDDTSVVYHGIESATVQDYYPEIAKKTTLSKPHVVATFRGVVAALRPSIVGQGLGVEFRSTLTHIPRPTRQPTEQKTVGDLYHVQVNRGEFRHSGPVRLGGEIPLGYGPHLRGETRSLRLHQTVRFRKL